MITASSNPLLLYKGFVYLPTEHCDYGLFQPSISLYKGFVYLTFKADETVLHPVVARSLNEHVFQCNCCTRQETRR